RHVLKRMLWMAGASLALLALLAWLMTSPWFYEGLEVAPAIDRPGVALILFFLVLPVFTFVIGPLSSLYSRKHEFEADAFAARQVAGSSLVQALVKLYEDNAATLTPDPVQSAVHDSHSPAPRQPRFIPRSMTPIRRRRSALRGCSRCQCPQERRRKPPDDRSFPCSL